MQIAEMRIAGSSEYISIRPYITRDGEYGDFESIAVSSSNGLEFTVEPNRGLDISSLSYRGIDIGYRDPVGVHSSSVFDYSPDCFEKNMFFGMLTTCGLENTGPACSDKNGIYYSKHGSLNYSTASDVAASFSADGKSLVISGSIAGNRFGRHHFLFSRKITFSADDLLIGIEDSVSNSGDRDVLCIMYHYNFGAPFLSPDCKLSIPYISAVPKDAAASDYIDAIMSVSGPEKSNKPHVFYLSFDEGRMNAASISNSIIGIQVRLLFSGDTLPCMDLWKCLKPERYVMAFEPCNAFPYGRTVQEERGTARYLDAGETEVFRTYLQIGGTDE